MSACSGECRGDCLIPRYVFGNVEWISALSVAIFYVKRQGFLMPVLVHITHVCDAGSDGSQQQKIVDIFLKKMV